MWNENYVASVEHPKVKLDQFIVSKLKEAENKEYEFLFNYSLSFQKIDKFNTKKILVKTYNLGKLIDEKFSYKPKNKDDLLNADPSMYMDNFFLHAIYETHLEFDGTMKSRYEKIQKKLNKQISDHNYTEEEKKIIETEEKKILNNIYKRRIEEIFLNHDISKNDINELNQKIKDWIDVCGLPKEHVGSVQNQKNLFSIVLLAHQLYLYIKSDGKINIEVKLTQSMSSDYKRQISVDTINDLIIFLAMNYFISDRYDYVFCEICGNMVNGKKNRKTCSDMCRKRKSRMKK